ncbi:PQQ-binding-like beta-propeller repeat protein [Actinoplanes sp. NPDC023714]|uniref:outer membrane protein assembly factor BamB family protein n=1 Tax=Actinoplanes sp. NPDC023714 TaxID=3154322 RepID=UPI0033CB57AD
MTDPVAGGSKEPGQEAASSQEVVKEAEPESGAVVEASEEPPAEEPRAEEPPAEEPPSDEPAEKPRESADGDEPAVVFSRGTASAAEPDPDPTTVVVQDANGRNYAAPVDPWAGHGAGFQTPVDGHFAYPRPLTAAKKPRRRTWILALVASVVTLVLAVATAAVVYFWPRYPSLDFERLSEPTRFPPVVPVGSTWSDATVAGQRIYFASSDPDGKVGVTAVDGASREPAWSSTAAGTAKRWAGMEALPFGVALDGRFDDKAHPSKIVLLGAANGELLWTLPLAPGDKPIYGKNVVVHVDTAGHQLIGFDAATGNERWRLADLSDTGTRTLPVGSAGDLNGPTSLRGRPFDPQYTDQRLVQINADHSVRVIDLNSGTVGKSWQTGAATDDEVFAHNGRLVVRESGNVRRVVAYDLESGSPDVLYTAEPDVEVTGLTPCGDEAVCFVKTRKPDGQQTVVRIDLASSGSEGTWESGAIADVVRAVPVGASVVVQSRANTTLIDEKGATAWTHPGTVARLDAGNILRFGHVQTDQVIDESVSGQHLGDEPVELGAVYDVRTTTCAWTISVLGCVTATDYVTQRFAR